MKNKRTQIFVVFAAVIGLIGWIIADGFKDTMVYYVTVSELQKQGKGAEGQGLRVSGLVVPGSLSKSDDGLAASFRIDELGSLLDVDYRGILPDTFKEDGGVLLEGKYENGRFVAARVFTKCASKYESETPEKSGEPYQTSSAASYDSGSD